MANKEAQIKPTGLNQKHLIDLLCMLIRAIKAICVKLDDDTGVTLTTYEANVFTAIFNGCIIDSRGNSVSNFISAKEDRFFVLTPTGYSDKAMIELIYQIFDMMETLTEQLDGDSPTDADYEALCYTALYLWNVENSKGSVLGNGTTYYFKPGGMTDQKQLVNLLAQAVNSIDVLTKKLDADGTVNDTDYEALCDTAIILYQIENTVGTLYGNALTTFMP